MPQAGEKVCLGIDPGRDKTGLALVDATGKVLLVETVPTQKAMERVVGLLSEHSADLIAMGDGTTSRQMADMVRQIVPELPLELVDEKNSTLEARSLYWEINPPTGLKKILPEGLRFPDVPLDGYAAAVQARRYFAKKTDDPAS